MLILHKYRSINEKYKFTPWKIYFQKVPGVKCKLNWVQSFLLTERLQLMASMINWRLSWQWVWCLVETLFGRNPFEQHLFQAGSSRTPGTNGMVWYETWTSLDYSYYILLSKTNSIGKVNTYQTPIELWNQVSWQQFRFPGILFFILLLQKAPDPQPVVVINQKMFLHCVDFV